MVLLNLGEIRPPGPGPATITYGALLAGEGGADDVRTMVVTLEAGAFTAVTLRANADADLVDLAVLGTRRDQPTTAALVSGEDLIAMKLEDTGATQDVGWLWFGGW